MKIYKIFFPVYNKLRYYLRLKKRIKGSNNILSFYNIFISKSTLNISGNKNSVFIAKSSKIGDLSINILGNNNKLEIEKNCIIKGGCLWLEGENCHLRIGHNTTIEAAHIAVTENNGKILIGDDCMLSNNIEIRNGDSHSIIDIETSKRINQAENVIIGNHVWVGSGTTILKGVTINDNSIVGTGSIVTNSCLENSIIAGIPAKVVKQNITWKRERI